ncbi:Gfo/Idh/MocA family oxidoreductase [Albimonas sp. CAU 1670]|uniref:Gfo/Idh/MocA family protein n=1 Tax=Albimonas sp. CAU 1670 TaxID=3032599 RepID=UPI0023D9BC25|nr:Gfo/Idh/MocA family oxidoreductase [Albimonas sp. CAU 1670]MDF2231761.1 Gfo/Idh/MocA family oxidoreductase [Albimonas sp. CAU 1670]
MGEPWKVGIVGLGIMGRRMLEHMGRHPKFEVVAMWDPSAEACARAAALAPGATVAPSAEAVIEAAQVVYLACPPVPRKAYALHAAGAGKAVFLEKPFGVDVAEARDLARRLEASGVPAAVNFTQAAGAALTTVVADKTMGAPRGVDIVVTYGQWPRAWQVEADWLRFAAEGGYVREVISHFLFFSARVLGPLSLVWSRPTYPADPALCETHIGARLETAQGVPVSVLGSVGGVQPDRQEVTVTGTAKSWRISDFYRLAVSDGGPFEPVGEEPADPRAESLRAQLDDLDRMMRGELHRLATVAEALAVQELVEAMLARDGA